MSIGKRTRPIVLACLVGCFWLQSLSGLAQLHFSAEARWLGEMLRTGNPKEVERQRNRFLIEQADGQALVHGLAEVSDRKTLEAIQDLGGTVLSSIGSIHTLRLPLASYLAFSQLTGVKFFQLDRPVAPHLDSARVATRVDQVHAGLQLPRPYTGKGVLIGNIDGGFDYMHPTFYSPFGEKRWVAVWDQNRGGTPPAGYTYGHEWKGADNILNAQADTLIGSHAMHVLGIAAGSGFNTEDKGDTYRGVAPEADLAYVATKFTWARVLDGIVYLADLGKSRNQPVSINVSLGGYNDCTMDGTSLIDRGIETLVTERKGVVVSVSAGNDGNDPLHIKKTFAGDTLRTVVEIKDSLSFFSQNTGQTMGWGLVTGEPGKDFSFKLSIHTVNGTLLRETGWIQASSNALVDSTWAVNGSKCRAQIAAYAAYPSNNRPAIRLYMDDDTKLLQRVHCVWTVTAPSGEVHVWNCGPIQGADLRNKFPGTDTLPGFTAGNAEYTISEPASSRGALTVGAYATKTTFQNINGQLVTAGSDPHGEIAFFSSRGPLIDGRIKPDITAPGHTVVSAISRFDSRVQSLAVVDRTEFDQATYRYAAFSGTSMSCPVTAGVVALMLERNPYLGATEIMSIIKRTAYIDGFTGTLPSEGDVTWGHGKVDAWAALKAVRDTAITGRPESELTRRYVVFPNPLPSGHTELQIVAPNARPATCTLYDLTGKRLAVHPLAPDRLYRIPVSMQPGLYFIELSDDFGAEIHKLIVR
jgi:subtilisin family serine protease